MNLGFIGVGGIAGNYLNSLHKLDVPVAAVCDLDPDRARQVAAERGATAYASHTEMLNSGHFDAVFVCIPPGAHEANGGPVADVALAGAAVFVAKPVALELESALRALEAISRAGVVNQAGYMARYSDVTAKAQELVAGKEANLGLGRFMCRMGANHPWWGREKVSGGQMVEQSTHVFDWLRLFLGEVDQVFAQGHSGGSEDIADFPDSTLAQLQFRNGALGNIASTCCANVPDGFSCELSGRDWYLKAVHDFRLTGTVDEEEIDFTGEEAGYFRQVEQFLKAVESNSQAGVKSSYEDATRTLALTLAANQSLREKRPVEVRSL